MCFWAEAGFSLDLSSRGQDGSMTGLSHIPFGSLRTKRCSLPRFLLFVISGWSVPLQEMSQAEGREEESESCQPAEDTASDVLVVVATMSAVVPVVLRFLLLLCGQDSRLLTPKNPRPAAKRSYQIQEASNSSEILKSHP